MGLIDADALMKDIAAIEKELEDMLDEHPKANHIDSHERTKIYISIEDINVFKEMVEEAPTVEERPRGEWEVLDECSNAGVYCSKCHKKVYNIGYSYNRIKMPYCPNCGSYNGYSVRGEGE